MLCRPLLPLRPRVCRCFARPEDCPSCRSCWSPRPLVSAGSHASYFIARPPASRCRSATRDGATARAAEFETFLEGSRRTDDHCTTDMLFQLRATCHQLRCSDAKPPVDPRRRVEGYSTTPQPKARRALDVATGSSHQYDSTQGGAPHPSGAGRGARLRRPLSLRSSRQPRLLGQQDPIRHHFARAGLGRSVRPRLPCSARSQPASGSRTLPLRGARRPAASFIATRCSTRATKAHGVMAIRSRSPRSRHDARNDDWKPARSFIVAPIPAAQRLGFSRATPFRARYCQSEGSAALTATRGGHHHDYPRPRHAVDRGAPGVSVALGLVTARRGGGLHPGMTMGSDPLRRRSAADCLAAASLLFPHHRDDHAADPDHAGFGGGLPRGRGKGADGHDEVGRWHGPASVRSNAPTCMT